MSKIYRLKPWDEVTSHHFISRETWDALVNSNLYIEFGKGLFGSSVMISTDKEMNIGNMFIVDKDDLYEVEETLPADKVVEKTYTKDDIRNAGARAMKGIVNEDDAIISALAIAKLINELN